MNVVGRGHTQLRGPVRSLQCQWVGPRRRGGAGGFCCCGEGAAAAAAAASRRGWRRGQIPSPITHNHRSGGAGPVFPARKPAQSARPKQVQPGGGTVMRWRPGGPQTRWRAEAAATRRRLRAHDDLDVDS